MVRISPEQMAQAMTYYAAEAARYYPGLWRRLRTHLGLNEDLIQGNLDWVHAVAAAQEASGLRPDGCAGPQTLEAWFGLDLRRRLSPMRGTLNPRAVRLGVPRGRYGLRQRRVRAKTFGEPEFEWELVAESVHPQRPHRLAWLAWRTMVAAATQDGVDPEALGIYSAYRSVAFQKQVFDYRLEERRTNRREAALPVLPEADLRRLQRKWTAEPGTSAHHTGLALDLNLYKLGKRESKRSPAYAWLAQHAVDFGFYPYFPEGWHWEYNPPGLIERIVALRAEMVAGEPVNFGPAAPRNVD